MPARTLVSYAPRKFEQPPANPTLEFARAVITGLADHPRWLPCRYLYDEQGSRLFDRITETPEYYLTRTETAILERAAPRIRERTGPRTLVELGSGTSAKTRLLLSAYAAGGRTVRYVPVDVSSATLGAAARAIALEYPSVRVEHVHGTYETAFPMLRDLSPTMLVFLGSTIGNLNQTEAAQFWSRVRRNLCPGDFVLLGVDLVKETDILNAAYNDVAGYSAAFTKNLFARINRELGADIDLDGIAHRADYLPSWQRVEIYAELTKPQTIAIRPLERSVRLAAGERIMTEISRKFVLADLEEYLGAYGLETREAFTDDAGWYAVLLLERAADA